MKKRSQLLKKALAILGFILTSYLAGVLGSSFIIPSLSPWYADLIKPEWTPPDYIFSIVWLILYTLMGIAAYFVWEKRADTRVFTALLLFVLQLSLNSLWTIIFFGLRYPELAMQEILLLLVAIVLTTISFYRIDKKAGVIMVPYIAWVIFASALNYSIIQLN